MNVFFSLLFFCFKKKKKNLKRYFGRENSQAVRPDGSIASFGGDAFFIHFFPLLIRSFFAAINLFFGFDMVGLMGLMGLILPCLCATNRRSTVRSLFDLKKNTNNVTSLNVLSAKSVIYAFGCDKRRDFIEFDCPVHGVFLPNSLVGINFSAA